MTKKRTYTIPVLLVIITLLVFLIIVLASRTLLDGQSLKTERGERLAERYNYCLAYADTLKEGTQSLISSKDAASRLSAKQQLGQLTPLSGECLNILYQSGTRSGLSKDDAHNGVIPSLNKIAEVLTPIGDHDGPLTDAEKEAATTLYKGAQEIYETLQAYSVPTGGDRYRQMQAGVEWVPIVQKAAEQLRQTADALK